MLSPLCLLLLVRLGGYMVNLCAFYSYRLIGKLTAFLHFCSFRSSACAIFHYMERRREKQEGRNVERRESLLTETPLVSPN
jgi:nitrate/nitrite transporter NarK